MHSTQDVVVTGTVEDINQHQRAAPGNTVGHTWYDSTSPETTETVLEPPTLHY